MVGTAILYHMPSGFVGDITRMEFSKVEGQMLDTASSSTYVPAAYGLPVKLTSGLVRALTTGDAGTAVYGWLVRPYPTSGAGLSTSGQSSTGQGLNSGLPPTSGPVDVMKSGYMSVKLANGTAVRGAAVWTVLATGSVAGVSGYTSQTAGDLIDAATATTLNNTAAGTAVACQNTVFMGPVDTLAGATISGGTITNGTLNIVEISFNN